MENCRWLEKVIIEERGNCIFWCKEKGAKLQTGCTGPFWFTASATRTGAKSWLFWGHASF